ncbi:MAG: hypothetical protein NZL91_04765 [Thermoflexales bacterium]|nr:hypothetical protein [Thermoflexales bacterium]MDW8292279.1 hypothetical protein [Anaerolineae bacterium]
MPSAPPTVPAPAQQQTEPASATPTPLLTATTPAAAPTPQEQKVSKPIAQQAAVVATIERIRALPVDEAISVWDLIGAPHLPWVALNTSEGVVLLSHRDGSLAGVLPWKETRAIAFGAAQPYLAVLTDEAVKVLTLNVQSAVPLLDAEVSLELPVSGELVNLLGFSPRDTYLLLLEDNTVRGYTLRNGKLAFEVALPVETGSRDPWVMTDDERLLLYAPPQGNLLIVDVARSKLIGEIEFDPISALAISPDGKQLAIAENRVAQNETYGEVLIPLRLGVWEMSILNEREVSLSLTAELPFDAEFDGANLPVTLEWLQFYPGERPLLLGIAHWRGEGDTPSRMLLWELSNNQQLARHKTESRILGHALADPSGTIATYQAGDGIALWSVKQSP